MANAPVVQTLAQSMADLDPGFSEQRGLVNEQISGLGGLYGAQRDALEGARVKGFNTINDQAVGRGAAFSGIPLGEQADYLADKFLPGMTNIANQENAERMTLRKEIAGINQTQNAAAISRVDQQTSALNSWNLAQAQMEAQRREAELNRQFQASQSAADRAARAASAGGGGGGGGSAAPNASQYVANWASTISKENPNWQKNYSWENSGIKAQLQANYGISGADSYKIRKQLLGY